MGGAEEKTLKTATLFYRENRALGPEAEIQPIEPDANLPRIIKGLAVSTLLPAHTHSTQYLTPSCREYKHPERDEWDQVPHPHCDLEAQGQGL